MHPFDQIRFLKRDVGGLLPAAVIVAVLLPMLAACGRTNSGIPRPYTPPPVIVKSDQPSKPPPPIAPEIVRGHVEQQESWGKLRKAGCPRRVLDRTEEMARYPAIHVLKTLQYATVEDYSSAGYYEKLITLTSSGRIELRDYLDERADKYVFTVARRKYKRGSESYSQPYGRDDRLTVHFQWVWTPLNALGERLSFWAPLQDRDEHFGYLFYTRTAEGWKMESLTLEHDRRDYEFAVSR